MRVWPLVLLAVIAAGCGNGTLPDPNEDAGGNIDLVRSELNSTWSILSERMDQRQFDDRKAKQLIARRAEELIKGLDLSKVATSDAWKVGEVYITARHWKDAERVLRVAVKEAKNEDRRVNDTLRLARSVAEQGRAKEAIAIAHLAFNTPDGAAAPILPAVLLEIAPAARGRGADLELARLVEEAIRCHERTIIDPGTTAGKAFLMARLHHVSRAWSLVEQLYQNAGRSDLARQAFDRADRDLNSMRRA